MTLDLAASYSQEAIDPNDQEKTAFTTILEQEIRLGECTRNIPTLNGGRSVWTGERRMP